MAIRLSEMPFHSIQGEGKSIGIPAIFIRLTGCNLDCNKKPFICDTPQRNEFKVEFDNETFLKVLRIFPCSYLVFTGGEPLLQQKKLVDLFRILRRHYTITIETNATILPEPELDKYIYIYNVSPKLSNSGNKKEDREKPEVLRFFAENKKASFKFVVANNNDIVEVSRFIREHRIRKQKVSLMPAAISREELQKSSIWLVNMCKRLNYKFSYRLHIQLYNNTRGR